MPFSVLTTRLFLTGMFIRGRELLALTAKLAACYAPPPSHPAHSSRGPGRRPLTAVTRVQIPYALPIFASIAAVSEVGSPSRHPQTRKGHASKQDPEIEDRASDEQSRIAVSTSVRLHHGASEIRESPVRASLRRATGMPKSVRFISRVGNTRPERKWPPMAAPSRRPRTTCA